MTGAIAAFPVIRKRDGRLSKFDSEKITKALFKALDATGNFDVKMAQKLTDKVLSRMKKELAGKVPEVEQVQDIVEKVLVSEGLHNTAKAYILYRAKRSYIRDGKSSLMDAVEDILEEADFKTFFHFNSASAKMLKIAQAASSNYYLSRIIPTQFSEAHRCGDIYIHDLEYYAKTIKSFQIPVYKLLKNGFFTGYGHLRPPKRISSVSAQLSIIYQSCQNDLAGEQSIPFFDKDIALYSEETFKSEKEELFQAMEAFVYNLNNMYSRAGSGVPVSSLNIGTDTSKIGRALTLGLLTAIDKGLGKYETPLFPTVIFRLKDGVNIKPTDTNYDLFQKAIKVACKRMNPVFSFMDASFNFEHDDDIAYWGNGQRMTDNILCKGKSLSCGNIGMVTINLPRCAIKTLHKKSQTANIEQFYLELKRVLRLSVQFLLHKKQCLSSLTVKELPFIMGEKLCPGTEMLFREDKIEPALHNFTLSVGFTGLEEAIILLNGKDRVSSKGSQELGLEIVEYMRNYIDESSLKHKSNFVLSVPSKDGLSDTLFLKDNSEYGLPQLFKDKKISTYTNGFTIAIESDAANIKRIGLEAPYHKLTNGGHFTFLNLHPNQLVPSAVEKLILKMKEKDMGFGGISFPIDECGVCGSRKLEASICYNCGSNYIRKLRRGVSYIIPFEYLPQTVNSH